MESASQAPVAFCDICSQMQARCMPCLLQHVLRMLSHGRGAGTSVLASFVATCWCSPCESDKLPS